MTSQPIPCQRFLFDVPEEVVYLNCAYMAPSLKSVRAAGEMGVARKSTPWMITPEDFFTESDKLRALVGELLGCRDLDVAIIPSVSYGIATAAANLPLEQGKHCLVLAEQFPSNFYPWVEKGSGSPGQVITVTRPDQGTWTQAVLDHITTHTGIVALPHCHWTDGTMLDLEKIGAHCASRNIPLVLDVTQSLGVLPLNLEVVKPAFLVAAAYKWLLGPYSLAYLYVDPAHQNGTPLEKNWITRRGSRNFGGLVNYTEELLDGAVRFDMGERSNFALLPMAISALEQLLAWDIPSIQASLRLMTLEIAERAEKLGFYLGKDPRAGHMLGIRRDAGLPENLVSQLAEQNVFVGARGNALRISPHLYNNEGDMDRFFDVLAWLLKQS